MATLAFFIALAGGAYAAFNLPKNSVKSDNIVNGQVKGVDLAGDGKFKSAGLATMNSVDFCGSMNAPQNQWVQFDVADYGPAGYYRDVAGNVHLLGWVQKCGTPATGNVIFVLPPGYRPGHDFSFPVAPATGNQQVDVTTNGNVLGNNSTLPILSSIEFPCAPPGKSGCP
jgi:hypothetical protein